MLVADQTDRRIDATTSFCWSCGIPDPGEGLCGACEVTAQPRRVARSELIGATATIRQRLRNRSGLVVAETATSALLAFPDASVAEAPREKIIDLVGARSGASVRSSAWTLVSASRAIVPSDRRKLFNELISSFVLRLVDRSVDEARAFALDALDADCPAWLDKLPLTTSERDFLFASYHADRGSTGMALERLLRLPADRYPTKDLVFLHCLRAIRADATVHDHVRRHLRPFYDRPVARALLSTLGGPDVDEETWLRAASTVLSVAPPTAEVDFPRAMATRLLGSIESGSAVPDGSWALGPECRMLELANAARSGGSAPQVTLADLLDAPASLTDDAIELGVLAVSPEDREHPLAKYVLGRTDPDVLTDDDLVDLDHQTEVARRAFLHGDQATLGSLPKSAVTEQLRVLDDLRAGDFHRAMDELDVFDGQTRDKVQSIAQSLARGSIDDASNEVLTDGTTWPVLAHLLPDDTSALSSLSTSKPALRGIAAWRTLSGSVSRLWGWDWEGALVEAKRCLQVARDEHTRDEALNLIACADWQLREDAGAIAALSSALEGNYTEGLQVNIGVVAAALEPRLAGEHLGKLAAQAPTLGMRASAASRALELWYADPDPWDRADGQHALPEDLRGALRQLVRSDIGEASFVQFARTMSRWDGDWLGGAGSLSGSPFGGSAAAAVYQAKARDFEEFVKTLAGVLAGEDPPGWATDERDSLVGSAIAALEPGAGNPTAASFGLVLIDGELPMEAGIFIDLVGFTVVGVCDGIDPAEAEPKERFLDLVVQARGRIGEVSVEEQDRSSKLLDFAASQVIRAIAVARAKQYDKVADLFNDMASRLRGVPSHQINRSAVRSGTQPAVDFLSDTARIVERLITHVPDEDFRQQLVEFRDLVRQLLTSFNGLRGS